jgi:carbon storage regulator
MLVLTRKKREGVLIAEGDLVLNGENIVIRIIEIQGDRVRIGIEAPQKYQIAREELIKPEQT